MGDIADGGVPDGVVMLSGLVGRGCVVFVAPLSWACLKIEVRCKGVSLVGQALEECLFFVRCYASK